MLHGNGQHNSTVRTSSVPMWFGAASCHHDGDSHPLAPPAREEVNRSRLPPYRGLVLNALQSTGASVTSPVAVPNTYVCVEWKPKWPRRRVVSSIATPRHGVTTMVRTSFPWLVLLESRTPPSSPKPLERRSALWSGGGWGPLSLTPQGVGSLPQSLLLFRFLPSLVSFRGPRVRPLADISCQFLRNGEKTPRAMHATLLSVGILSHIPRWVGYNDPGWPAQTNARTPLFPVNNAHLVAGRLTCFFFDCHRTDRTDAIGGGTGRHLGVTAVG